MTSLLLFQIKGNTEKVFTKFVHEGKATLRFSEPPHDICVSKVGNSSTQDSPKIGRIFCDEFESVTKRGI